MLFYVLFVFVLFYVLFACKCVLYYCHRVLTQMQLTNISYRIISYHKKRSKIGCFDFMHIRIGSRDRSVVVMTRLWAV